MIRGRRVQEIRASKNILYTTIRIEDGQSSGTGFFYHSKILWGTEDVTYTPLLVTNKHVIEGSPEIKLTFHLGPELNFMPSGGTYEVVVENPERQFLSHPSPEIDICAMDITAILSEIKAKTGKDAYYQALSTENLLLDGDTEDLFPIEDVYMIGYPGGLWDKTNNLPIARKGITASDPRFDYNAEPKGLVDIASFEGSSGSPIILIKDLGYSTFDDDRKVFFLLGILEALEPIDLIGNVYQVDSKKKEEPARLIPDLIVSTNVMMHIGKYIQSRALLELEPLFY